MPAGDAGGDGGAGADDDAMSVGGAGSVNEGSDGWFSDGDVDAGLVLTPRAGDEGESAGAEADATTEADDAAAGVNESEDDLDLDALDASVTDAGAWERDTAASIADSSVGVGDPPGDGDDASDATADEAANPSIKAEWEQEWETQTAEESGGGEGGEKHLPDAGEDVSAPSPDAGEEPPPPLTARSEANVAELRAFASARLEELSRGPPTGADAAECHMLSKTLREALSFADASESARESDVSRGAIERLQRLRGLFDELSARASADADARAALDALFGAAEELHENAQGADVATLPEAGEATQAAGDARRWVMAQEETLRTGADGGAAGALLPECSERADAVAVAAARLRAARLARMDAAAREAAEAEEAQLVEKRKREVAEREAKAAAEAEAARAAQAEAEARAENAASSPADAAASLAPAEEASTPAQSGARSPAREERKAPEPAAPAAAEKGGGGCCVVS